MKTFISAISEIVNMGTDKYVDFRHFIIFVPEQIPRFLPS
jgi:hypothetical protein